MILACALPREGTILTPTCCRKLELDYIILRPLRISEDYESYLLQK